MPARYFKFDSVDDLEKKADYFLSVLRSELVKYNGRPIQVSWKLYTSPRSLPQNKLYWKWVRILAEYWSKQYGVPIDPEQDMHPILVEQFLGRRDVVVFADDGREIYAVRGIPVETKYLDKGEFHRYLELIDAWATQKGFVLPHPEDSDYMKYREAQIK